MMGVSGEPSGYYPMDSNGMSVGTQPPAACVCVIYLQSVCAPLVDRNCSGGECEEGPPDVSLPPNENPIVMPSPSSPQSNPVTLHAQAERWNINWKESARWVWDATWGFIGGAVGGTLTSRTIIGIPLGTGVGAAVGTAAGEVLWQAIIDPNWDDIVSGVKCGLRNTPRHIFPAPTPYDAQRLFL